MKVMVVAAAFSTGMSGIQRHAVNVVRSLLTQRATTCVVLVLAEWQQEMVATADLPADERLIVHFEKMGRGSGGRNLWYYRALPSLARRFDVDIVHLSYPAPLQAAAMPCPVVVTLHDLYPYEIPMNFGFPKFLFNRIVLRQCLMKASAIACVSDITLARLATYFPSIVAKAVRVFNCVEPATLCAIHSPIPGDPKPFLLCVAQHRRNKNIPLLIDAFDRLLRFGVPPIGLQLVVVGISGPETERIRREIADRNLQERVHLLQGLTDAGLQRCYAQCELLVSPSSIEGFGLPVAEALLAGCRVVCSDIPAHREIAGDACRYVSLRDEPVQELTNAIAATLHTPHREPTALPAFRSERLGGQYLELYQSLVTSEAKAPQSRSSVSLEPNRGTQLP